MPAQPTDEDKATYLSQKLNGGGSGRLGVKYEARASSWFTVRFALDVAAKSRKAADMVIATQTEDYVNDIRISDSVALYRGEMKSGQSVEMKTSEFKSLRWDFSEQMAADGARGIASQYYLFLANSKVERRVREESPEYVTIVVFPNSSKPSEVEQSINGFCAWLFSLLPQKEMAKSRELYDKGGAYIQVLDYNDTHNVYQWFTQSFEALGNNEYEYFDVFLDRVSAASNGLIAFGSSDLRTDVKDKIAKIDGIAVVACEGRVFYRLENGVRGHLTATLEQAEGKMFQDFIMSPEVSDWQGVLDVFEKVEALVT